MQANEGGDAFFNYFFSIELIYQRLPNELLNFMIFKFQIYDQIQFPLISFEILSGIVWDATLKNSSNLFINKLKVKELDLCTKVVSSIARKLNSYAGNPVLEKPVTL